MSKISFSGAALLITTILWASPLLNASPLSSWTFRVLQTDHFELIYRTDQVALAKRYALAAEQAYSLLIPIFKEAPAKTTILLTDETDASNGLATFLPYPSIFVYPVLPSTLDSIDEYGDWPLEMLVHEYTHILNMYSSHGFYVPLKWIFGNVVRPNAILPKWYLEGLAVNNESHLTDHGRLRASETQAAARVLVLGNKLRGETIDRINQQDLTTWPYGARPYLFGGWWWNQVQKQNGSEPIETWNQNFSRRLPFLLNEPMRAQTKLDASGILAAADDDLETQAKSQLASINAQKTQPLAAVAPSEVGEQSVFSISPDGQRLVYWVGSPNIAGRPQGSTVYLKVRLTPQQSWAEIAPRKLCKSVGTTRGRWLDNTTIVYDELDLITPHVTYRDLWLLDTNTQQKTRLTTGLRAQEPAASLNGNQIAFIQNDGGRNRVMLLDRARNSSEVLVNGNLRLRLSGPEFISDNELIFAARTVTGSEQLRVYNLTSKKVSLWNEDLMAAQHPRLTAKGVMVSDSRTGVRNVYLVGPGHNKAQALSNTRSDIQTVDYDRDRDELLVSELTPDGRRLMSFPFAQYTPPAIDVYPLEAPPQSNVRRIQIHDESYQPITYLLPHYWIPFIYPIDKGVIFQGISSGNDPVGRNNYSLFGSYDTITQKPSYGINYVNSSLPSDIYVNYAKMINYYGASGQTMQNEVAAVGLINDWPFNNRYAHWGVGAISNDLESGRLSYHRTGGTAGVSYSRLSSPLNNGLGWQGELNHQEYFAARSDSTAYGHTDLSLSGFREFSHGQSLLLHTRAGFAPKMSMLDVINLGDHSIGANYLVSLTNSQYLVRGYPSGAFVGRKILNANLEYAVPLKKVLGGYGTFPLFLGELELALFVDTLSVDGGALNADRERYLPSNLSRFYSSTGAEFRMATTAAYHLPINVILGTYYGFTKEFGGGFTPFLGLGLGSLEALENKTP